jgi:hypothetical protein
MKIYPRTYSGLISVLIIFVLIIIKEKFDLSENFYYVSLGIVGIICIFLYDFFEKLQQKYNKDEYYKNDIEDL